MEPGLTGLPALPGAYLLQLRLARPARLVVGRLGEILFPSGVYLYAGSARGPGGLAARLGRHLHGGRVPHWHIDALRAIAEPGGFRYLQEPEGGFPLPPFECRWSQALAALPGAWIAAPGFGASDCLAGCPAHLVGFKELPAPITAVITGETCGKMGYI